MNAYERDKLRELIKAGHPEKGAYGADVADIYARIRAKDRPGIIQTHKLLEWAAQNGRWEKIEAMAENGPLGAKSVAKAALKILDRDTPQLDLEKPLHKALVNQLTTDKGQPGIDAEDRDDLLALSKNTEHGRAHVDSEPDLPPVSQTDVREVLEFTAATGDKTFFARVELYDQDGPATVTDHATVAEALVVIDAIDDEQVGYRLLWGDLNEEKQSRTKLLLARKSVWQKLDEVS